jgi:PAS domain S-box-containing protein
VDGSFKEGQYSFECKHRLADGSIKDIEVFASPTKTPEKVDALFLIIFDITQRKEIENELHRLYKAVYYSSSMVVIADTNARIQFINPKFEEITGYSFSEVIGKNPKILNSGKNDKTFGKELWQKLKSGNEWKGELINKKKDGSLYWEQVSISPVKNDKGEIINYIKVAEDITQKKHAEQELKKREELFRFLTENSSDIIYKVSFLPKHHFEYISPSIEKILGYPIEEYYKDINNSFARVHPDERDEVIKNLENHGSKEFMKVTYRAVTKSGEIVWLQFNHNLIKNEQGELIGFSGAGRDVTKEKIAEIALKQSENELRELNATKDKFFSIIAHDMKNPFSALLHSAQNLKDDYYDFSAEDKFHKILDIYESSQHLYKLLENLLQWSRSQTGKLSHNPEEIDIYESAFNTTYLLKNAALKKDISLKTDVKPETYVYADYNMVNTILRNLASNAVKFTPIGGEVMISSRIDEDFVEVFVKDNGIGISPENIDKLFRIDISHSTKGTNDEIGTGLGLILCKEFVEKNGGILKVNSKLNEGSVFSFTLPRIKEENIGKQQ